MKVWRGRWISCSYLSIFSSFLLINTEMYILLSLDGARSNRLQFICYTLFFLFSFGCSIIWVTRGFSRSADLNTTMLFHYDLCSSQGNLNIFVSFFNSTFAHRCGSQRIGFKSKRWMWFLGRSTYIIFSHFQQCFIWIYINVAKVHSNTHRARFVGEEGLYRRVHTNIASNTSELIRFPLRKRI